MEIVELSAETTKDLAALFYEFWPDETSLEKEQKACKNILKNTNEKAYLLRDNNTYVGFIHASLRHEYVAGKTSPYVAYIEGIYIREAFQNKGYGSQLVGRIEGWALSMGCTQIGSDTEIENENSVGFHKHMGYQEAERIVCFIKSLI